MRVLGAVLAGGRSRRFGSDKAVALLDGRPLIVHAIAALEQRVDAVIVCGRDWGDWVPDRPGPDLGPLGGLNAALHAAAGRGFDAVLSVPCDVVALPLLPFVGAGYAEEMPVIGLWPVTLAPLLDSRLAANEDRSVRRWARMMGVPAVSIGPLVNINRREDLRALTPLARHPRECGD